MPDYSKGCIYKIVCKDVNITEKYIGSTTNFTKRKQAHKYNCNNTNRKSYNRRVYEFIRDNGGFENFQMIEIEKYSATDKRHLEARERYWKETAGDELGCYMPSLVAIACVASDPESVKAYKKEYEKNNFALKAKKKEYQKIYEEENKERIAKYKKKHREDNIQIFSEKSKQYYRDNVEKIREKFTCECGSITRRNHRLRHERTIKHQNFINKSTE